MQNGIEGDLGTALPQTQLPADQILEEKKMARFSKTKEYQRLKDHINSRIEYYQTFLPGNQGKNVPSPGDWAVANAIVLEFRLILNIYEGAREVVENVEQKAS